MRAFSGEQAMSAKCVEIRSTTTGPCESMLCTSVVTCVSAVVVVVVLVVPATEPESVLPDSVVLVEASVEVDGGVEVAVELESVIAPVWLRVLVLASGEVEVLVLGEVVVVSAVLPARDVPREPAALPLADPPSAPEALVDDVDGVWLLGRSVCVTSAAVELLAGFSAVEELPEGYVLGCDGVDVDGFCVVDDCACKASAVANKAAVPVVSNFTEVFIRKRIEFWCRASRAFAHFPRPACREETGAISAGSAAAGHWRHFRENAGGASTHSPDAFARDVRRRGEPEVTWPRFGRFGSRHPGPLAAATLRELATRPGRGTPGGRGGRQGHGWLAAVAEARREEEAAVCEFDSASPRVSPFLRMPPASSSSSSFLLLFRNAGPDVHAHLSPAQRAQLTQQWNDWYEGLARQGKVEHGRPLALEGRVVSGAAGERVTDGPFAETKEVVGGYFFLTVADLDEATEIAKRCPGLPLGLTVEVRPVADVSPVLKDVPGRPPKK